MNAWNHQVQLVFDKRKTALKLQYETQCLNPLNVDDQMQHSYTISHYQWTLFYYDRAGNLIRTVSPKGVVSPSPPMTDRSANPQYQFASEYDHNTVGQVLRQQTPDGGNTKFWHNKWGELRFSQSDRQASYEGYTFYDYLFLGPLHYTGEIYQFGGAIDQHLNNGFPTWPPAPVDARYLSKYNWSSTGGWNNIGGYSFAFHNHGRLKLQKITTDRDGDLSTTNDFYETGQCDW